jgi:hypothetical protein
MFRGFKEQSGEIMPQTTELDLNCSFSFTIAASIFSLYTQTIHRSASPIVSIDLGEPENSGFAARISSLLNFLQYCFREETIIPVSRLPFPVILPQLLTTALQISCADW